MPVSNQNANPNVQPGPVMNQNPPPIAVLNQNPQNPQNPQAMPGANQNRQPVAVTNQGGPNGMMPANQNPQFAQLPPEAQSEITCAQAGRAAVSQCFQQNGGFQMVTVIALLSNGTQGMLPPNSEQVKQTLCQYVF